ncbi:ubiquitin-protein ligase [Kordia periserrulae]|uniref:Ubiquitin-protein ligase n=2 Tax=Kordia periserrulae TaxID=701523 RepID=A0A2T6BYR8_9FLAO|nr:ubiquitin-protein ligase [Kordia periserrulae]
MTPQEIRKLRLKNDYKEMVNIKGDIITWEAINGNVPYIEAYKVTLKIKGITGKGPTYRDTHIVNVKIPADYPRVAPEVRMESQPVVFHPNWYRDGKWCFGTWIMSEGLGHHIVRMARTLQYDLEITNEESPANREANSWFLKKKGGNIFPCDTQLLPDPTKEKMNFSMKPKKKFTIN